MKEQTLPTRHRNFPHRLDYERIRQVHSCLNKSLNGGSQSVDKLILSNDKCIIINFACFFARVLFFLFFSHVNASFSKSAYFIRSKQGDILPVLRQLKDFFSTMKYTYILLLETSQESQGHFQQISISFQLEPKVT